jgi:hypothetical protein
MAVEHISTHINSLCPSSLPRCLNLQITMQRRRTLPDYMEVQPTGHSAIFFVQSMLTGSGFTIEQSVLRLRMEERFSTYVE